MHAPTRAFTLVEVLVVLLIMGVTTSLVLVRMGNRDDIDASAAARVVISDLTWAQNRAIASATPVYVSFDTGAGQSYSLKSQLEPTEQILMHPVACKPWTVRFGATGDAGLGRAALVSASFDGASTLVFDELGEPQWWNSASGTAETLTSGAIVIASGARQITISIEPFTGAIKLP